MWTNVFDLHNKLIQTQEAAATTVGRRVQASSDPSVEADDVETRETMSSAMRRRVQSSASSRVRNTASQAAA